MLISVAWLCLTTSAAAQEPVRPTPPPVTPTVAPEDWHHLRIAFSPNFSKDASHYDGPRSSYFIASWTTRTTTAHVRWYIDPFIPREVDNRDLKPRSSLRESLKELFVKRRFPRNIELTAGDIRATAHSDNNKVLYTGDGKPLHSSIVEIDRVLGVSAARSWGAVKAEATIADRGRKDLKWDGLLEAFRVSRSSTHGFSDIQVTFVNRTGADTGGVAAPHQWQAGAGGTYSTPGRLNAVSGEYVHGNFLPGRTRFSNAFSLGYERRLRQVGGLSLVADYEHVDGLTGVSFYEAGAGANVVSVGAHAYIRVESGWRRKVPVAATEPPQNGGFLRLGLIFDRGNGSIKLPAMIRDTLPSRR
jgi:hypothetical protein